MRREIVQLVSLSVLAIAAFFATRAIAASNREMTLRDAAEWYRRGERQLGEGNSARAIDAFRRAAANDRTETRYVLALADALAREGQLDAARSALMPVRRTSPDDREINVQLARLAAARQNITAAVRYYRDALYAPWPPERAGARRTLRFELVDLMLEKQRTGAALAELLALAGELPDDAALHVAVAQRFARAGDDRQALMHFQRALRVAPDTPEAFAGAGLAAFRLGEYEAAGRLLRRAPDQTDGVRFTRTLVDYILESDPLARRLRPRERRRRVLADLTYAERRLEQCLAQLAGSDGEMGTGPPEGGDHWDPGSPNGVKPGDPDPPQGGQAGDPSTDDLLRQVHAFETHLRTSRALDHDAIDRGLELVTRLEHGAMNSCPPATSRDRALVLMTARHGSAGQ